MREKSTVGRETVLDKQCNVSLAWPESRKIGEKVKERWSTEYDSQSHFLMEALDRAFDARTVSSPWLLSSITRKRELCVRFNRRVRLSSSLMPDLATKENRDWGVGEEGSVSFDRRVIVREGAGFDLVFEQIPEISP